MDMKVMAEELPQKFTKQACINDAGNGNVDGFKFQLSVSKEEVHSKEKGKKVIEFDVQTLDTSNEEELKTLFQTRNYSTNVWNSTCHGDNYIGMTGVTLDFVCYRCHRDPDGEGGNELGFTSRKTMEQLSEYATGYHD